MNNLWNRNHSRRSALKALVASSMTGLFSERVLGQAQSDGDFDALFSFLESLRKKSGGYAWPGQEVAHLTPTLFAIGCYQVLGFEPPRKSELAAFTWNHHPQKVWPLSERRFVFDHQHLQALVWLGEDVSSLKDKFSQLESPRDYNQRYEKGGNPFFQAEIKQFISRQLLGLGNPPESFVAFLDERRRKNGSFNTTPASDGGDGNILNTWWGLEALDSLGRSRENRASTIKWIRACQLPGGGFTHQPDPEMGGMDDVAYTWAAVKALKLLGGAPTKVDRCIQYLGSLANWDGGSSDRLGWQSNPMASYYALDALATLGELKQKNLSRRSKPPRKTLPSDLKVFSAQIESHGRGSPKETVALAKALKIHLWGAKNATPEWRAQVNAIARREGVPVTFFRADEEYGSWVEIPGSGTYSHIADIMAPYDTEIGESLANKGPVPWQEFRVRRVEPLRKGQGRLNWQFGQHEDVIRLFLDDSLMRPGYSAISTFHFGNIDFSTSEPFLHRWRGQIPFIALQDAHGNEPWWFCDQTEGMRTLFLGTEATWDAWLKALKNNWVAAVRHDYRTKYQTWIHSGSDEITAFIKGRELDWRWWDNPDIGRPMVSLVAVRPEDELEMGRPEEGVNLRIRTAHRNTNHGVLKEPLSDFEALWVNGEQVEPEVVSVPSRRSPDSLEDQYRLYSIPSNTTGRCEATVVARVLASQERISETIEITV